MEDYPRNLTEFEARFSSEEDLPGVSVPAALAGTVFRCPGLRLWKVVALLRKVLLQCAACGRQTSVTAGTIFQDTRSPLPVWFRAMWWGPPPKRTGASALGTAKSVGPQQVRNGLDVAAQNAARDGAAGTGFAGRDSGSRRKLLGRTQRGPAGPKPEKQSIDRSGRSRGWEGHRPDSHEENRGCVEREPVAFRGGVHRAGQRGAYRRLASLLRVGKGRLRPSGHGCQPAQAVPRRN